MGQNGTFIQWQGQSNSAPTTPQLNWAYYNSGNGTSYIYDGATWQPFANSLVWKGNTKPVGPAQVNWAY
ncbi:MAG: hypothetical protein NVS3B19_07850 [Ginsengibacter sp.]